MVIPDISTVIPNLPLVSPFNTFPAQTQARAFFASPAEQKVACAAGRYGERGYCAPGVEAVSRTAEGEPQRPADAVESFVFWAKV